MIRRRQSDDDDDLDEDLAAPYVPPSEPVIIDYNYEEPRTTPPVVEQPVTAVTPPLQQAAPVPPTAERALATTTPAVEHDELQDSIEAVRLLTALLVGGTIEGADQLVTRLRKYEQELEVLAAADAARRASAGQLGEIMPEEDELDRLRFAMVGFVFEAQDRLGKGIYSAARLADSGLETADNISRPFRNFFLFRPVTKRIEERLDNLVEYGRDSIARWTATGRDLEPRSRALATRTYEEVVDEFIQMLAENEEIKDLVATQGISLVAEVRDGVRGRTVSADSSVESLVRRVLRRPPRSDLPEPPAEVQRWAGVRIAEDSEGYDANDSPAQ